MSVQNHQYSNVSENEPFGDLEKHHIGQGLLSNNIYDDGYFEGDTDTEQDQDTETFVGVLRSISTHSQQSKITVLEDHPQLRVSLIILCASYTIAAANEYWVVNWLKDYNVNLPIFMSLVQNASWPIQLFFYERAVRKLPKPRVITKAMYKSYFFLGSLAAFISLSRMFGLSALPPTIYVICANTEIVFETMMTKLILNREVSWLQIYAVFFVLAAVALSLYDPVNHTYGSGDASSSRKTILVGVMLSLASRFASSLNTILAEQFLGKDAKSTIGVSECSVANSVIPFFLVPIALIVIPECQQWTIQLPQPNPRLTAIITLLFIALCMSKHVDRLSKYGIVNETSTIFFAGIDSAMKMVAGIGSFFFFNEEITWCIIVGFGLVAVSVVLLYFDKVQRKKALDRAMEEARRKEQDDDDCDDQPIVFNTMQNAGGGGGRTMSPPLAMVNVVGRTMSPPLPPVVKSASGNDLRDSTNSRL